MAATIVHIVLFMMLFWFLTMVTIILYDNFKNRNSQVDFPGVSGTKKAFRDK